MIQFNLLPDVKLTYVKAERTKRLVLSVSTLASAVAVAVFIALFLIVNVAQKTNISNLTDDIKSNTTKLKDTPELDKVLTIQNQLASLTALHDAKPKGSRLFTFVSQVTPSNVNLSNVTVDYALHTITITGTAPSLDTVNKFTDTLKFTTFTTDKSQATNTKAFSNVVLSTFGRTDDGASYSISLAYDPLIFDITNDVNLVVPKTVTTRSVTEQPTNLFKASE